MSAPVNPGGCANCGASLSLEQLRGTDCPFCNKVFPHHRRAVEQAALVNQIMAGQLSQGMYGGQPPVQVYTQPPQISIQYGASPPQMYNQGQNPFNQINEIVQRSQQAQKTAIKTAVIITIVVVVLTVLIPAIVMVANLLL
jgi:hypothetical protein